MTPPLHADLTPLSGLIGTWRGEGKGDYPTVEPFTYGEEITVSHAGKPFLFYCQLTWKLADRSPLHTETGYFRLPSPGIVELVLSQPSGVIEAHAGTVTDGRIELRSVAVGTTPAAKKVTSVGRTIELRGDELWYRLDMAAVGQPYGFHLEALLHRTADW
jgi:hypothetical protein